jgi:hypothetical protein
VESGSREGEAGNPDPHCLIVAQVPSIRIGRERLVGDVAFASPIDPRFVAKAHARFSGGQVRVGYFHEDCVRGRCGPGLNGIRQTKVEIQHIQAR